MHVAGFLEKCGEPNQVVGHRARLGSLLRLVEALLDGGRLSLIHIGHDHEDSVFVNYHTKAVDPLLGNRHLQRERRKIGSCFSEADETKMLNCASSSAEAPDNEASLLKQPSVASTCKCGLND